MSCTVCLTHDFVWKLNRVCNVEEDVAKSPPSSPASPQNTTFVSSSKPPSSQPDSSINEVSSVASKALLEDESASLSSSPPPSQQQQQPLVNGKSGSSPLNGVAPVRHENGTNKNIEIDIPPGTAEWFWIILFLYPIRFNFATFSLILFITA